MLILFSKALLNHGGVIVDLSLEGIGSVPICEGGSHTEGRAEQAEELGNFFDRIASFVLGTIEGHMSKKRVCMLWGGGPGQ